MTAFTRLAVATGVALLCSVAISAQGAKGNYKGLEITVTGVERASNVGHAVMNPQNTC